MHTAKTVDVQTSLRCLQVITERTPSTLPCLCPFSPHYLIEKTDWSVVRPFVIHHILLVSIRTRGTHIHQNNLDLIIESGREFPVKLIWNLSNHWQDDKQDTAEGRLKLLKNGNIKPTLVPVFRRKGIKEEGRVEDKRCLRVMNWIWHIP